MANSKADIERELIRARIRAAKAVASRTRPSRYQNDCEAVIRAIAARRAGLKYQRPVGAMLRLRRTLRSKYALVDHLAYMADIATARDHQPDIAPELLEGLELASRVLEIEETCPSVKRPEALERAGAAMGITNHNTGEVLDPRRLADRLRPVRDFAERAGFIPIYSFDPELGEMAPTRFMPSELEKKRGRPKED